MSTLEQRVLEAIEATGLNPADLATKIGISKQGVYDWRRGDSVSKMKGENLVELAELSGYEPLWIMKGKGPKKKSLTQEQQKVLSAMQESEDQQNLIAGIVDSVLTHKIQSKAQEAPKRLSDERRQREITVVHERRKIPFNYRGEK
jgi:hypothetical protein